MLDENERVEFYRKQDASKILTEALSELKSKDLDNLQWAKDFMDRYEKKHGFRTEEPLKDYRQHVLDGLVERAKQNGVI